MSTVSAPERYRRRRRWPAVLILVVLAAATSVIWISVLQPQPVVSNACNEPGPAPAITTGRASADTTDTADSTAAITATDTSDSSGPQSITSSQSTPAVQTSLGTITDKNTLAGIRPASPAGVQLRVMNASKINGLARTITEQFREAGFLSIAKAQDDPLYPAYDLRCYGEIRYGMAGLQQARAVLIVAPCATLVIDDRIDDSVDFAIGALYKQQDLSPETIAQLAQVKLDYQPPNVIEGQTAAEKAPAPPPPLPQANCPS